MATRLNIEHGAQNFEVLYIGQAYGRNGERNALDRLRRHETLQRIALEGIPNGYIITVLMLEVILANRIITVFNPWADDKAMARNGPRPDLIN